MRLKEGEHLAELPDADPFYVLGDVIDPRVSFFLDGDDGHQFAVPPGTFEYKEWEVAVAGDEAVSHRKIRYYTNNARASDPRMLRA